MSDIKKIKEEFINKLKQDIDLNSVNQIKTDLFGKNGKISNEFKKLGSIAVEERKKFASELNSIKDEIQTAISKKIQDLEIIEINSSGYKTIYNHPYSMNCLCAFEFFYFMNPHSYILRQYIRDIRKELGITLAKKELNYEPKVLLDEGLDKMIAWGIEKINH